MSNKATMKKSVIIGILGLAIAATEVATQEIYHIVTDRVQPIADGVALRRDDKESAPVVAFASKDEQLHYHGTLVPGQWISVTKQGSSSAFGYVQSEKLKIGNTTDYMRRSLPGGVVDLRTKSTGGLDSDAALFYNGQRVGDKSNYSGLGEMWLQGKHIVLAATGHAGNSAEWCDLYDIYEQSAKYLGPSSCNAPKSTDGSLVWEDILPNKNIEKVIVKDGIYTTEIVPHKKLELSLIKEPKGGTSVTRWDKKYPFDLFEDASEKKRFSKIMSEADFESLTEIFQLSSPCALADGYLICTGNKKVQDDEAIIVLSIKTGSVYAAILTDNKETKRFGGKNAPPPLENWLLDKQVKNLPAVWSVLEDKSPVDDRLQFTAYLRTQPSGRMLLILRCKEGSSELFVRSDDYLGTTDRLRVAHRINKNPADEGYWNSSVQGQAVFYPGDAQTFMDTLPKAGTFFVRVYDFRGIPHDASFQLSGIEVVRKKVFQTCRKL